MFHPEKTGTLDLGSFYAPKTQLDKSGHRILWGWIQETRPLDEYKAAGWAGMMSLPRVLTLAADGQLRIDFAAEANRLRKGQQRLVITPSEEQNQRQIGALHIEQCCGEVLCSVRMPANPFELSLCDSAAVGTPWLTLKFDPLNPGQVWIDSKQISVLPDEKGSLELHLYIDGSVIEVFLGKRVAYTKRFYYPGNHAPDASLKWLGMTTGIESLSVWQLSRISSDRLTS